MPRVTPMMPLTEYECAYTQNSYVRKADFDGYIRCCKTGPHTAILIMNLWIYDNVPSSFVEIGRIAGISQAYAKNVNVPCQDADTHVLYNVNNGVISIYCAGGTTARKWARTVIPLVLN